MFLRNNTDINYYFKRNSWLKYVDAENLNKKTKFYLRKIGRKVNDTNNWVHFKYWLLWNWVNDNFELSEKFIVQFSKNIKKLELKLSPKEEKFFQDVQELVFTSWRPLKEFPVKFDLDKKETINLTQSRVNVHFLTKDEKGKEKVEFVGKYNVFYSSKNMYLTNENQEIQFTFDYPSIKDVRVHSVGVVVNVEGVEYMFRGENRLLTYVMLQRMVPALNLDIKKVDKLYNYFDFWNTLLKKIN